VRLFIAVKIPFGPSLRELAEELKACPGRVKWVEEENFHVTLKFLGEVPEALVDTVDRGIKEAVEGVPSSVVVLRGVGAFPNLRRPRVIWVGMDSADVLRELQRRVESSLTKLGFEREKKPFHPHVTLGRVKRLEGGTNCFEEVSSRWEEEVLGKVTVDRVYLIESTLTPRGPLYTVIYTYPLEKRE